MLLAALLIGTPLGFSDVGVWAKPGSGIFESVSPALAREPVYASTNKPDAKSIAWVVGATMEGRTLLLTTEDRVREREADTRDVERQIRAHETAVREQPSVELNRLTGALRRYARDPSSERDWPPPGLASNLHRDLLLTVGFPEMRRGIDLPARTLVFRVEDPRAPTPVREFAEVAARQRDRLQRLASESEALRQAVSAFMPSIAAATSPQTVHFEIQPQGMIVFVRTAVYDSLGNLWSQDASRFRFDRAVPSGSEFSTNSKAAIRLDAFERTWVETLKDGIRVLSPDSEAHRQLREWWLAETPRDPLDPVISGLLRLLEDETGRKVVANLPDSAVVTTARLGLSGTIRLDEWLTELQKSGVEFRVTADRILIRPQNRLFAQASRLPRASLRTRVRSALSAEGLDLRTESRFAAEIGRVVNSGSLKDFADKSIRRLEPSAPIGSVPFGALATLGTISDSAYASLARGERMSGLVLSPVQRSWLRSWVYSTRAEPLDPQATVRDLDLAGGSVLPYESTVPVAFQMRSETETTQHRSGSVDAPLGDFPLAPTEIDRVAQSLATLVEEPSWERIRVAFDGRFVLGRQSRLVIEFEPSGGLAVRAVWKSPATETGEPLGLAELPEPVRRQLVQRTAEHFRRRGGKAAVGTIPP